jgi:arylsulfatase A
MNTRREFFKTASLGLAGLAWSASQPDRRRPNFVIILCDDLGYGDLGCFGHPTIATPNLDRLAFEGQKWTSFYTASSVCTPSRAALLTGRLPIRSGMCDSARRVLFPNSAGGLPANEITLAELLKSSGYAAGCIGKWHLGHLPAYLPTNNGFDSYYGIPYSNDMNETTPAGTDSFKEPKKEYFNVPLMRNTEIVERPADQNTITKRYVEESVDFIKQNQNKPFFLYLAHNMPHVPLFRSPDFKGASLRGRYGDVVQEIDWGVGRILQTLKECGIDRDTLVVFTSDNGPWLTFKEQGGSGGLLRDGKGSTFEGGHRVPAIFWWPDHIAPAVMPCMGSTLDILPTFCGLAGIPAPGDRVLDGFDITPTLLKKEPSPRKLMFFYRDAKLFAVRKGAYKAHFFTQPAYGSKTVTPQEPPLLFNVENDPGETVNISATHADVLADLAAEAKKHWASVAPGENQMIKIISK